MSESPLPPDKALQEADLLALTAAQAQENRFIEFKSEYLPQSDSGKKKFLQSVAAFANSRGGDLVLGMAESNGIATALSPLNGLDPDQSRIQIHDLIRVHLRPALGGVKVDFVSLAGGGHAVVVRVPKSWTGPHILTYGDDRRFYIRDEAGKKRPMEFEEVRDGFLAGETTAVQLRNFRMERCAAILNDETPGPLFQKQRIVLHLLPYEMFGNPRRFEVRDLYQKCAKLCPIEWSSCGAAFDIDGCYSSATTPDGRIVGYAYIFRSGAIEAVDAQMLEVADLPKNKIIPYTKIEHKLIGATESYLQILRSMEIPPPYACFLSLLNVRGHFMPSGHIFPLSGSKQISRDHLYFPECVFDPFPSGSAAPSLRPIFDSIWNACGMQKSPNFDQDGNWKPR